MPPEEIWLNDDELSAHFEGLKLKRETDSSNVEQVPMDDNHDDEIARWRR